MAVYLLGSRGPEVTQIQQALSPQFYSGSPDGIFGGGTESAVRAFQLSKQLDVDGKVGNDTWKALFDGADVPVPEMTTKPIDHQCLALTGAIETQAAAGIFQAAMDLCTEYNVSSQRAAALMFDIRVQNGGIKSWVKSQIDSDFKPLDSNGMSDADREEAKLRIIATRVAASANPRWVADVQNRKLTIANGEGVIHGCQYNLEDQYGITLNPAAA